MATALPTFQSFDPSPEAGAPGPRWEKYVNRLKNLITALDIKNAERQKALLLHYVGEETNDIFDTLTVSEPADGETVFDTAVNAITSYLKPKRNIAYEEYLFRQAKQEKGDNNGILHPTQAISENMRVHQYRPRDQVTNYPELPINKTASKSIDRLNDNAVSPTKPRENHGAYGQPSRKFRKTTARGGQKSQQHSTRPNEWNWTVEFRKRNEGPHAIVKSKM